MPPMEKGFLTNDARQQEPASGNGWKSREARTGENEWIETCETESKHARMAPARETGSVISKPQAERGAGGERGTGGIDGDRRQQARDRLARDEPRAELQFWLSRGACQAAISGAAAMVCVSWSRRVAGSGRRVVSAVQPKTKSR